MGHIAFAQEDIDMLPPADTDAPDSEVQILEAPAESKEMEEMPPPPPPPMPKPPKDVPPPIPPKPKEVESHPAPKSNIDEGEKVFVIVEEMPEFPGGEKEMMKFIYSKIKYPNEARQNGIKGLVVVDIIIDQEGNITEPKILRDPGGGLGEEALRVVKLMPKWTPGKQRGKVVKVKKSIVVRFKLP